MESWSELGQVYIEGFEDGTFRPGSQVTRAEMAMMLARNLGYEEGVSVRSNPFPDVETSHWAAGAIEFVKAEGLMNGNHEENFNAGASMTRAEMATVVVRFLELELGTEAESTKAFPDITGYWAVREMAAVKSAGIVDGYDDGTFRPNGEITRDESVAIVNRTFNIPEREALQTPTLNDAPATHWAFGEIEKAVIRE